MHDDVALRAKRKSTLLYSFYEAIKNGCETLSAEDLDIAISYAIKKGLSQMRKDRI